MTSGKRARIKKKKKRGPLIIPVSGDTVYVETPRIGMRMEKSDNGMRGVMTFWEKRESVGGTTTGDKSRIVIYRVTAGFLLFRVRGRRVSSSSLRARARIKLPPRPVRRRRDERDGTVATKTCPLPRRPPNERASNENILPAINRPAAAFSSERLQNEYFSAHSPLYVFIRLFFSSFLIRNT